jgi:hypothetical protein
MTHHYLLTTDDAEQWRAVLPANTGVMGSLEYIRVSENQTGWPARLFVFESPEGVVAYPYFLRPVHGLPFANHLGADWWDTVTPDYTGPIVTSSVCRSPAAPGMANGLRFADAFAAHSRENRIVAEFAHLNPWHVPEGVLDRACIQWNREIVYVDLTWDEERVWRESLNSDCRRQVRQAQRANVRVRRAESPCDVKEFHRLYAQTMQRREAPARYHYPLEYFLAFFHTMPENSFYMLAEYQGRVVAGGLYFHDRTNIYWHLSAFDLEFARVRPVNAYLFETIRRALGQGKQRMLLGGGYQPGDGILHFKSNFSRLRERFCTYKRVHDAETYSVLMRAWSGNQGGYREGADFFPAYRSPLNDCGAGAPAQCRVHFKRHRLEPPENGLTDGRQTACGCLS